ncbi:MAG TPA: hypothetical protein P5531_03700 [Bacteroidales bacterium]|nr:hypothetical protein [Bacteroidales bacterium]HSA42374.1 hypothetical protein [Bacteroidales bacterium]
MKLAFVTLLFAVLMVSCKKDKDETVLPGELAVVHDRLAASFDTLNTLIGNANAQFAQSGIDTSAMRAKLLELFNTCTFSEEFVFTTPQGILQIIEPPAYYAYQGSDISNQPHVITAFQTKQPVLSNAFDVVEGYQAAVDIHPIIQNSQVIGAISAVFEPARLLGRIIEPIVTSQGFEMWVMEKTGVVLFDQDTAEIGLNVLTDPLYANYPELLAACQKIAAENSGETSYSFFQTGTSNVVKKKTFWMTFSMHGNEWKIIWVKPE